MVTNIVFNLASAALLQSAAAISPPTNTPEQAQPQPTAATALPQSDQAISAPSQPAINQNDIIVRGKKPTVDNRLDRKVYDVSNDISRTAGSAADLLEHIPSVSVDLDGNVSIRGNGDVQVLVNGRPSAQLNGSSLGAALQQFSANRIEKIEVITTPPASLSGSATGGLINIILKPSVSGKSFNLVSSVGSAGRFNLSPSGEMNVGSLRLRASLGIRRDVRERTARDDKDVLNDVDIPSFKLEQTRFTKSRRLGLTASGGAGLDLSKRDHADLDLTYSNRVDQPIYREYDSSYPIYLGELGFPATRSHGGSEQQLNDSATITLRHDTDDNGNGLNLTAATSRDQGSQNFEFTELFPSAPQSYEYTQKTRSTEVARQLSSGYDGPLFGSDNLSTGYELTIDHTTLNQIQTIPTIISAGGLPDTAFTGSLRYAQTFNAGFITYRTSRKKWTVEPGIRFENVITHLTTDDPSDFSRVSNFDILPSFHVSRTINSDKTLKLGYSRRVTRPSASDFVSYPVQQDASTVREPNTGLKPQYTDAIEFELSSGAGGSTRSYTAYFRRTTDAFFLDSSVRDGITYVRLDNAGESKSMGLETVRTGHLTPSLDYNVSGSLAFDRVDDAGQQISHSTFTYNAKLAVTWAVNKANALQANVTAVGRRPTSEGYLIGYQQMDLGYRRYLSKRVAATITASDVLGTHKDGYEIRIPGLTENLTRRQPGRIISLSLSWVPNFKKAKITDKFGYEN